MNVFLNNENKALLWNILFEEKVFSDIPNSEVINVKKLFEENLINISNNLSNNISNSLVDLNKIAIKRLSQEINNYKTLSMNSSAKQKILESSLNHKQAEFESLIQVKKPEPPNFSDNKDKPFETNNMNDLLNQMISSRAQQLNQVLSVESAKIPPHESNNENSSSQIKKLNIGSSIELKNNVQELKKVSFSDLSVAEDINDAHNSFFKNLKKKDEKELLAVEYESACL